MYMKYIHFHNAITSHLKGILYNSFHLMKGQMFYLVYSSRNTGLKILTLSFVHGNIVDLSWANSLHIS